jgi:hypothetical protein
VGTSMRALNHRLALFLALASVWACSGDHRRDEAAVREFHQRLEQGRADLIYASSSEFLRQHMQESEFRTFLAQTRDLGTFQAAERAHINRRQVPGGPDIVWAFYNSRFTKASCIESFSWRVEGDQLRLLTYSCAPNMRVTCSGRLDGSKCETSPVPAPGLAGAP